MKPDNITVFTAGTELKRAGVLLDSCRYFGVEPLVALHQENKDFYHANCPKKLLAFVALAPTIPTEWVLYLDAFDTMLLQPLDALCNHVERSKRLWGKDMIVAAEKNCHPHEFRHVYPAEPETPFAFLNAGAVLAKKSALVAWSNALSTPLRDQWAWGELYSRHPELITLDTHCEVFQCGFKAEPDLSLHKGKLYNLTTQTYPSVLHLNGSTDHSELLSRSDYPWLSSPRTYPNVVSLSDETLWAASPPWH